MRKKKWLRKADQLYSDLVKNGGGTKKKVKERRKKMKGRNIKKGEDEREREK